MNLFSILKKNDCPTQCQKLTRLLETFKLTALILQAQARKYLFCLQVSKPEIVYNLSNNIKLK